MDTFMMENGFVYKLQKIIKDINNDSSLYIYATTDNKSNNMFGVMNLRSERPRYVKDKVLVDVKMEDTAFIHECYEIPDDEYRDRMRIKIPFEWLLRMMNCTRVIFDLVTGDKKINNNLVNHKFLSWKIKYIVKNHTVTDILIAPITWNWEAYTGEQFKPYTEVMRDVFTKYVQYQIESAHLTEWMHHFSESDSVILREAYLIENEDTKDEHEKTLPIRDNGKELCIPIKSLPDNRRLNNITVDIAVSCNPTSDVKHFKTFVFELPFLNKRKSRWYDSLVDAYIIPINELIQAWKLTELCDSLENECQYIPTYQTIHPDYDLDYVYFSLSSYGGMVTNVLSAHSSVTYCASVDPLADVAIDILELKDIMKAWYKIYTDTENVIGTK